MSENQSLRVPSCRRHKPSGQATVTINGQDICPGTWNTRARKAEYDRLIAEFLTHGRQLQSGVQQTVVEVLALTVLSLRMTTAKATRLLVNKAASRMP